MGRKKKGNKSSSKWSFSLTSAFIVLYALMRFGFLSIITDLFAGRFDMNQIMARILANFNVTNIVNVMMVSLQVKLLAAIAKGVSGPSLGKIWKFNLRW